MNAAGATPADRLKALLLSDFDTVVYTREKLAAWIAFWGETQGRPFYDQICAGLDAERQTATESLCRRSLSRGGYEPRSGAHRARPGIAGRRAVVGLGGAGYSGQVAPRRKQVTVTALAAFFPRHLPRAAEWRTSTSLFRAAAKSL